MPSESQPDDEQIQRDLIEQQEANGPTARNVAGMLGLLYSVVYWSPERSGRLLSWVALQAVVLILRHAVNLTVKRRTLRPQSLLRLMRLPVLASGLVWAGGYPLLFGGTALDVDGGIYLIFLVGMTAGATISYSLDPWAVTWFAGPAAIVLMGVTLRFHPWAAPAPLLFVGATAVLAHRSRDKMLKMIRLNYQNRALLEESTAERTAAEATSASHARFLAAASHDLRQPVQAVSLLTDALGQPGLDAGAREHLLSRLEEASNRLRLMLEAMLDLSRVDAGALKLQPVSLDARGLLESVSESVQGDAMRHDGLVVVRGRTVNLWADAVAIRRTVQNLAENAVRHGKPGGVVLLAARVRGDGCELQVWDNGPGVPDAKQELIFDEFSQLSDRGQAAPAGLGLGLSMVRRICEQCDWPLRVRSRLGHGSVFSVFVPFASEREALGAAQGTREAPLPALDLRLWLIEDDRDVRDSLTLALGALGCDIRSFAHGQDALQAAQTVSPATAPALLISDVRLSGPADGPAVITALRRVFGRAVPALLLSGDLQSSPPLEVDHPYTVLLTKPVPTRELIAHIQRALTLHD